MTIQEKLLDALYDEDVETVAKLIPLGADLNKPVNEYGWTPFMLFVKECYNAHILEQIIDLGGDLFQTNTNGETPFMIAIRKRSSISCLASLLFYGSDINHQDKDGYTALMNLICHPHISMRMGVVEYLINNEDMDLSVKNKYGKTAMDMAVEKKQERIVKMIKKVQWLKQHPEQRNEAFRIREERVWYGWCRTKKQKRAA